MTQNAPALDFAATELRALQAQPGSVVGLTERQRKKLVVSYVLINGRLQPRSFYADPIWHLSGSATNSSESMQKIRFSSVPACFEQTMRDILFRYWSRGLEGQKRPSVSAAVKMLTYSRPFLSYLQKLGVPSLGDVTPMHCSQYVQVSKMPLESRADAMDSKVLAAKTLEARFMTVQALYELSQYTDDPMPHPPWIDSSARHLAGLSGRSVGAPNEAKTPLIPDDVFVTLFQRASHIVQSAGDLLDVRDAVDKAAPLGSGVAKATLGQRRRRALKKTGWQGGDLNALNEAVMEIRTACYVVIAALSGCRNHELAFLKPSAWYSTQDDDGEVYWWMRSISQKTDEGNTEWMVPLAAIDALKVMERWAAPYQETLQQHILQMTNIDPEDSRISDARQHVDALFLGESSGLEGSIRTLSIGTWNRNLKKFAASCCLDWPLASHQFRRKFANYAARSQFGDLRYLREHFKHWSMDTTLGYALNESQEMALYLEIQDELDEIKSGVVENWLRPGELLAGGYGKNILDWRDRGEQIVLFKSHRQMISAIAQSTAIRSNGHAWCTADDNLCVGNDIERTRCSGCDNAVISKQHGHIYTRLYTDLREVLLCDDIGEGGKARVQRDMERCRSVMTSLGHDPSTTATA